jgi:hypothetical protein
VCVFLFLSFEFGCVTHRRGDVCSVVHFVFVDHAVVRFLKLRQSEFERQATRWFRAVGPG